MSNSKVNEESNLASLKSKIKDRPVAIWGARALGCGICRAAERLRLNVIGFIDSDPCFRGRKIMGYEVMAPEQLRSGLSGVRPYVITASALSEEILARKCADMGMEPDVDYCSAKSFCDCEYIIDIAGVCNLRCPSCPRGNYSCQPKPGFMPREKFEKVLGKILAETPDVSAISLFNWGEPLLHPELPVFIEALRERKIFCSLSTNFNIDRDLKQIIQVRPDMLKVSLSGFYQHTYGIFHEKGNINLVKSNLYRLRYLVDRHHPEMIIEVIYHKYRNNREEDFLRIEQLCAELGFILSSCVAYFSPVEKIIDYVEGRFSESDRKLADLLLVDIGDALKEAASIQAGICPLLDKQIVINWDGSVSLCCASFDPEATRVKEDFLTVTGREIKEAKLAHPLCRACVKYGIDRYYSVTSQNAD